MGRDEVLGFMIYDIEVDSISISADGSWAIAWLNYLNPRTGEVIPTEPGMALANQVDGEWQVVLQADSSWANLLVQVPEELLSGASKSSWLSRYQAHLQALPSAPLTGYLLPWAEGESKFLTRSIAHGIGGSMHYAFDFAEPGFPSDVFSIYASKSGLVKYAVWTYPDGYFDGNCDHSNFLVVEDPTTDPVTYVLYLHLAQDSIPSELRQEGAPVGRARPIPRDCRRHGLQHRKPSAFPGAQKSQFVLGQFGRHQF